MNTRMCLAAAVCLVSAVTPYARADEPLAATNAKPRAMAADLSAQASQLRKRLPDEFSVLVEQPFIVVGDSSREEIQRICEHTVRWAVERLKQDYFERDPDEMITIWLFKDDDSYRSNAKAIFNDEPTTPYGYYSAAHRALIMNIATGTGTLVHEIVHPFVRANFPNCPAWLNEGLGSLYEQCGEREGHIVGYTNWRLAGLQRAIKTGRVPSFKELTGTNDRQFYGEDKGTNYAQARYLCYYLQEQGKLRTFFRDFVVNQKDDPTGYRTLVTTIGAGHVGLSEAVGRICPAVDVSLSVGHGLGRERLLVADRFGV